MFVLIASFIVVIAAMGGLLWFGWWISQKKGSKSPYSRMPMLLGIDIAASVRNFVNDFLLSHEQPDNSPIDFEQAAICSETGRIFPNSAFKGNFVRLDWSFLQRRFPGRYVSWGSLSELEQATIRMCHESLSGYQTEISCPRSLPQEIDTHYALTKPGPLYVDRHTKILLGWKEVPGTEFEVLIVQKPIYESIDDTL
ncbi:MAG: hypothetical protein JSR37_05120 [Verrucomicrobia bacterium]|nr:hypothetical protein [Verrucomicrobiota bacterium]MBS0637469.1 hypothetical protein [Verrucomicrobiota bacterium]